MKNQEATALVMLGVCAVIFSHLFGLGPFVSRLLRKGWDLRPGRKERKAERERVAEFRRKEGI